MLTTVTLLKAAHVFCTTLGLSGLAVVNIWLAQMARGSDGASLTAAARTSFNVQRIVGPLLGIGILLGFWLAYSEGAGFLAPWLVIAYVLVLIGGAIQGTVAIPWVRQAMNASDPAAIAQLDNRRPAIAAWAFTINLALIVFLMVVKPG
jgi:uncharacterized membrane protein (Fun14 family)